MNFILLKNYKNLCITKQVTIKYKNDNILIAAATLESPGDAVDGYAVGIDVGSKVGEFEIVYDIGFGVGAFVGTSDGSAVGELVGDGENLLYASPKRVSLGEEVLTVNNSSSP